MIVGIDLGTTNSLLGFWRDGAAVLVPNALASALTPSVVSVGDDGQIIVGRAARDRLTTHPTLTAASFKRYMGTSRAIPLGDKSYRPEELSALVLRALKADAEAYLGEKVEEAIITVPAYFNDAQRKATKAAGELAGLKVDRLLTEPTAAALAYGVQSENAEETILVVDLGGGTFDVSLLQRFDGVTEVCAAAGDSWLGGEDWVAQIVAAFIENAGNAAGLPPMSAAAPVHAALRRQAELAMRKLSDAETASMRLTYQDHKLSFDLTRDMFEKMSEPLLTRLRFPIERALRDARFNPDAISRVILAGGASRMPMVRKLIGRLFKRLPIQTINPDEVVACGAAVRAGMMMRNADLSETVMTDVAPFSLGINIARGNGEARVDNIFLPIIERNTVIPASRVETVVNAQDNQTEILLTVYQGESLFIEDNIRLGELVAKVPRGPRQSQQVDVRFTYDTSGLLEVDTVVTSTGLRQSLVIEGNPGVLTQKEISDRLAVLEKLKLHPRDDMENQALIARAQRLFEEHLGFERVTIGEALLAFKAALETQHPDIIDRTRRNFEELMAHMDSGPLLD